MSDNNISYKTSQIAKYFSVHRVLWEHFYPSERRIIEKLGLRASDTILDIGCGCGGLGLALRERFHTSSYTGVEINSEAADIGRELNANAQIFNGDILVLIANELKARTFNVVFSLSCVDWNVRFQDMLAAAWASVQPGGSLVATFRLTENDGCRDFERSHQYINFEGIRVGERASYVVLNAADLIRQLMALNPSRISAYGYWGTPSKSAVTPYDRLCFSAFSITKQHVGKSDPIIYEFDLPDEILANLKTVMR